MTNRRKRAAGGGGRTGAILAAGGLALVLAAAGLAAAWGSLARVWRSQFTVEDRDLDVVVACGRRIHPEVITYHFGLTNGANLAELPFAERREELLAKFPNVREIKIRRQLPRRVYVEVHEREPAARIASGDTQTVAGRVADADGVVFRFQGDTSQLPVIKEHGVRPAAPGKTLTGHMAAALALLREARSPGLANLRVLSVDTAHSDYLKCAFAGGDVAKIAWKGMLEGTAASREDLAKRLKRLSDAMGSGLARGPSVWLAYDLNTPERITCRPANNRQGGGN